MNKLNFFSDEEKKIIQTIRKVKDKLLLPLITVLVTLRITPDIISYTGLAMLIGFIYYINKPLIASIFLLIHVFMDGLDGALARFTKKDSKGGAFVDIFCDHTGFVVVLITLTYYNFINPTLSLIYLYTYTLLIIFTIIRNLLDRPIYIMIRTKYLLYALFLIDSIWPLNHKIFNISILIFTLLNIPPIITSYRVIKNSIK